MSTTLMEATMNKLNISTISGLALMGVIASHGSAIAADVCNEAQSKAIKSIDDTYVPKIELWIKVSKALQDKGIDPRKYPVVMPDATVEVMDLLDVIKKLAEQRGKGHVQVQKAVDDCEKGIAPFQKITDIAVFLGTGGLSAVLPP